jgi:tetratricopeptide (TPR) repeat protein
LALLRLAEAESEPRQERLSRAADALRQAMELFDALDSAPIVRARVRYHVGRCYSWLGRWREAIALLEQSRETFSQHKTRPELASSLLELGQLYHMTGDLDSAHLYLKDALRLFRRLQDTDGIAVTQEALGNLALQTAHPSEAIVSLQEARQGYVALRRDERIQAIDDLLHIAHQANPPLVNGEGQS